MLLSSVLELLLTLLSSLLELSLTLLSSLLELLFTQQCHLPLLSMFLKRTCVRILTQS